MVLIQTWNQMLLGTVRPLTLPERGRLEHAAQFMGLVKNSSTSSCESVVSSKNASTW